MIQFYDNTAMIIRKKANVVANKISSPKEIMNRGDGSFGDPIDLPGGSFDTLSIATVDVNNDGMVDILVGNSGDVNQFLPYNTCPPHGGAQLHSKNWCITCPSFMGHDIATSACK